MRFFVIAILTTTILGSIVPGAVAAQERPTVPGENGTTTTAAPASTPDPERNETLLDEDTRLLDSGYNAAEGTAYVVIRSDVTQDVTISDGGALTEGSGDIASTTRVLDEGETARLTVPVTKSEGRVAVVIDTTGGLYGEVIEPSSSLFRGTPTWNETRIAALMGLAGGIGVVALVARRRVNSGEKVVERVL